MSNPAHVLIEGHDAATCAECKVDRLLRAVRELHSIETLRAVKATASERMKAITEAAAAASAEETWARYKRFKPGIDVWVHATLIGAAVGFGDKVKIESVQPRARRLWFIFKGKRYWAEGRAAVWYQFKTVPPKKDDPRREAGEIAKRLGELL